jgi:hypothetical protein
VGLGRWVGCKASRNHARACVGAGVCCSRGFRSQPR